MAAPTHIRPIFRPDRDRCTPVRSSPYLARLAPRRPPNIAVTRLPAIGARPYHIIEYSEQTDNKKHVARERHNRQIKGIM